MKTKVDIHRLTTGVPGLDAILGGGLPELSFNLIVGEPGTGKTTLAHQIMFALATVERPALYFTLLGEPPLKMLRYQQQFAFFDVDKINQSIRFVDLSEAAADNHFERLLACIEDELATTTPALVFVDSFRSLTLAAKGHGAMDLQSFLQQLGVHLSAWQATTFLIGEYFPDGAAHPLFTVADGLLSLEQSVHRNSMVRKLQVRKLRGQATSPGVHTFRITGDGISVFPSAPTLGYSGSEVVSGPPPTDRERLSLGVPVLDEMLGGGLPAGYSLLVAGPSGSGKTILATAFLAEGVRLGEAGVIVAFEQTPNRSRTHAVDDMVHAGCIGLINTRSLDLSIDEVVQRLLERIQQMKATRVVIDSLSGFELAVAPTFREDFRESLFRMVAALSGLGVTVLMTCELEDRYTDLRFSPYGSAFLTDAIVVQRYVEIDSCLRRVLAVVKLRGSTHSKEIREFEIADGGIVIGDRLPGYEGLLGGRPTHAAASAATD